MYNPLTRKLELFGPLPEPDKKLIDEVIEHSRSVSGRSSLIREGEAPRNVYLVLDGIACRSKVLRNGGRQIFAFLIPGDFCDLNVFILRAMDHGIETLSECQIAEIPRDRILEMTQRPHLARALWWATLVDEAILREWIVNMGQRDAEHRLAHLFCELHARLHAVGLASDHDFELPVTQSELAETIGTSSVHVNRCLQSLRAKELIEFKAGHLVIQNIDQLRSISGFNSNYLHLTGGKSDRESVASADDRFHV